LLQIGIDIGGSTVKAAAVRDGVVEWTGKSSPYARPARGELERAIAEAVRQLRGETPDAAGICVPGILNETRTTVTHSVNVPGLMGAPLAALLRPLGTPRPPVVVSDANATAYDIYMTRLFAGRLLMLVIGTGVGASVLDEGGKFLRVDQDSAGHIGQFDVAIEGHPVIGPDGGAGSLEGYLGAPAIAERYGPDMAQNLANLSAADPPMLALARAIRICHAIYCPHHFALTGGIGIRMKHLLPVIRQMVENDLSSIARPGWTLTCGTDEFHAAKGAAKFAAKK
jgi:predicted NBD/HSP70 family sugar kinase